MDLIISFFFLFFVFLFIFILFFFFFQAEDGIRDATVTGVQTCALPILAVMACHHIRGDRRVSMAQVGSRSEERRVGKSVDLGGRRIIKKKKKKKNKEIT